MCAQTSSGSPHIVVDLSAPNCAEQVKEISERVEQRMEQTNNEKKLHMSVLHIIQPGMSFTSKI